MAQAPSHRSSSRVQWLFLLQGLVATILGLGLLFVPLQTLFAIIIALGAYWFIRGVATLLYAGIDRSAWGWKLFVGVLGIIAGVLAMTSPLVTGTVVFTIFVYVIGFQAILSGFTEIYFGVEARRTSLILLGVVSVLLGAALVLNPWIGLSLLVIIAGATALVGGIVTIIAAMRGTARARAEATL